MIAKISVIVPVFNVEEYLVKCIESIRNQTYSNLEILLVNDGSTDGCGEICDQFAALDKRIKVIHKENGGLSDARNAGIEASTGDLLAFVDSDDWVDEDMYEVLYNLLAEHEADIAICRIREFSGKGFIDEQTDDIIVCDNVETLKIMLTQENNYRLEHGITNKLIKRDLIQNLRFPVGTWAEDFYFTPPLIYNSKKCVYINKAKYNYLTDRSGSIMNTQVSEKMIFNNLEGYQELERFLSSKEIYSLLTYIREHFLITLLYYHYEVKNSSLDNREELALYLEKLFRENFINSNKKILTFKRKVQISLFNFSPKFHHQIKKNVRFIRAFKRESI